MIDLRLQCRVIVTTRHSTELKKNELKKYRSFMSLQSHVEERSGTQTEVTVRERVVKLLQQYK